MMKERENVKKQMLVNEMDILALRYLALKVFAFTPIKLYGNRTSLALKPVMTSVTFCSIILQRFMVCFLFCRKENKDFDNVLYNEVMQFVRSEMESRRAMKKVKSFSIMGTPSSTANSVTPPNGLKTAEPEPEENLVSRSAFSSFNAAKLDANWVNYAF